MGGGGHALTCEAGGNGLTVEGVADSAVSLGPIVLFRYRHRATERWENGQVESVDAETNDDGTKDQARMWREGGPLIVEATGRPRYIAPANATPATHWNKAMLDGPIINTQHGKLPRPNVASLGLTTSPPPRRCPTPWFALPRGSGVDPSTSPPTAWLRLLVIVWRATRIREALA